MSKLQERIDELVSVSKAENPTIPEWYIIMAVEKYIREEEYEQYKDEIDELIKEVVTGEETKSDDNSKEQECLC